MNWIVVTTFLVVIIGLGWPFTGRFIAAGRKREQTSREKMSTERRIGYAGRAGAGLAIVAWILTTIATMFHSIGAGEVGVVYQFGNIVGQRGPGLQFTFPWQSVQTESIQVQRFSAPKPYEAFSKETQDVFIDATINYSVSPNAVQSLYRNVGPNWFQKLVEPRVNNFLKEATVKYTVVDIAPSREQIRLAVKTRLADELKPYSIDVQDFLIDNIDFHDQFKNAIVQKQVASQQAETAQNTVKIKQAEAQQAIEQAKGEAESTRVRAQGQADANVLIARSLTPEVIQFQALQKLADNIQIALIPSGQGVIIDPAALFGTKK